MTKYTELEDRLEEHDKLTLQRITSNLDVIGKGLTDVQWSLQQLRFAHKVLSEYTEIRATEATAALVKLVDMRTQELKTLRRKRDKFEAMINALVAKVDIEACGKVLEHESETT